MANKGMKIAIGVLCLATAFTIFVQDKSKAAELSFGYVDLKKVLDQYEEFQIDSEAYKKFVTEKEAAFLAKHAELAPISLLTSEERRELRELEGKPQPTEQEKERIKQLRNLTRQREEELNSLRAKRDSGQITEEEKKRLAELENLDEQRKVELEAIRQSIQKECDEKDKELTKKLDRNIGLAIAEVAKEKNISLVVDKRSWFYGGQEITDEVIKKLKGKPKVTESSFCLLDINEIVEGYKGYKADLANYQQFLEQKRAALQAKQAEIAAIFFLTEAEAKELAELQRKPNPTEQEKKRIQELNDLTPQRDKEWKNLRSKKDSGSLTEEEEKRLAELENMIAKRAAESEALKENFEKECREEAAKVDEKLYQKIRAAVAEVAKQKKISFVMAKQVRFLGLEISDEVLQRLNK